MPISNVQWDLCTYIKAQNDQRFTCIKCTLLAGGLKQNTHLNEKIESNSTWAGAFHQCEWVKMNSSWAAFIFSFEECIALFLAGNTQREYLKAATLPWMHVHNDDSFFLLNSLLKLSYYPYWNSSERYSPGTRHLFRGIVFYKTTKLTNETNKWDVSNG